MIRWRIVSWLIVLPLESIHQLGAMPFLPSALTDCSSPFAHTKFNMLSDTGTSRVGTIAMHTSPSWRQISYRPSCSTSWRWGLICWTHTVCLTNTAAICNMEPLHLRPTIRCRRWSLPMQHIRTRLVRSIFQRFSTFFRSIYYTDSWVCFLCFILISAIVGLCRSWMRYYRFASQWVLA